MPRPKEWPARGVPTTFKSAPEKPRTLASFLAPRHSTETQQPETLKPCGPLIEYGQLQTGMRVNVVVNDELVKDEAGHPLVLHVLETGVPTHKELFPVIKDGTDGKTKILPIGFKKPLPEQEVHFSPAEVFTQYTLPKRGTFVSFCNGKLVTYDSAVFYGETDENEYEPNPAGPVVKVTHVHGHRYLNLPHLKKPMVFSRAKYSDQLVFVKLYEAKELEELVNQRQIDELMDAFAERRLAASRAKAAATENKPKAPELKPAPAPEKPQRRWRFRRESWLTNPGKLVKQARNEKTKFLGKETNTEIPNPPKLLIKTLEKLREKGFHNYQAIYFPALSLTDSPLYPGLQDRPGNRLYEVMQAGLITDLFELSGHWAIIDTGERPTAEQARFSHPDDPLGKIIANARARGLIKQHHMFSDYSLDSRSAVSAEEQDSVVFVELAKELDLTAALQTREVTIRRPKFAEFAYTGIIRLTHLDKVNTEEYVQDDFTIDETTQGNRRITNFIITTANANFGRFSSGGLNLKDEHMAPSYFRAIIVFK